jgi:predicted DNA-binding helix-hairpin-helix protein
MDLEAKLELLAPAARFDACGTFAKGGRRYTPAQPAWNAGAITAEGDGEGRARSVFRVLMSSRCQWNCAYCPLRSANDTPRAALEPEELARLFLPRYEAGAAHGLFLSTGVDGASSAATARMLDAVELLRTHHSYSGYVHVKLLPGASYGDVERAARLANRISLNLEAPGPGYLQRISPERHWGNDLIERLVWARDWQRGSAHGGAPLLSAGLATQFVVGAAGEPDRELLDTGAWLYRELGLRRVYFGAFRPVAGTPLAELDATPLVRVRRLGEADWLLRHYGFRSHELPYDQGGDLPLHLDPKLAWALAHPERFPIELNSAEPEALLRVPGLGPISVQRILRLRRLNPFRDPAHLKGLGGLASRARDFVTLDGRFFGRASAALARHYARRGPIAEQLPLWE